MTSMSLAAFSLKFLGHERDDLVSNNARVKMSATAAGMPVTPGHDWSLIWTFHTAWDSPNVIKRKRELPDRGKGRMLINHIPGTLRMASKAHLPAFMRSAGIPNTTPPTYQLPEEMDKFMGALSKSGLYDQHGFPVWLLKKKTHRGVRALTNGTRAYLTAERHMMVQRRVHPLLFRGLRRSFDIGLYVLVSSIEPLRAYVYEKALVRVCEAEYPTSASDFSNEATFVISKYTPIWNLPFFAADLAKCDNSAVCALRRKLDEQGHNSAALFGEMKAVIMKLLAQLQPSSVAGAKRMDFAPETLFELFRFDFMVDAVARPSLTEVNFSPNLAGTHPEDERTKDGLVQDTLRIVTRRLQLPPSATAEEIAAAEVAVAGHFRKMDIQGLGREELPHERMAEILPN